MCSVEMYLRHFRLKSLLYRPEIQVSYRGALKGGRGLRGLGGVGRCVPSRRSVMPVGRSPLAGKPSVPKPTSCRGVTVSLKASDSPLLFKSGVFWQNAEGALPFQTLCLSHLLLPPFPPPVPLSAKWQLRLPTLADRSFGRWRASGPQRVADAM